MFKHYYFNYLKFSLLVASLLIVSGSVKAFEPNVKHDGYILLADADDEDSSDKKSADSSDKSDDEKSETKLPSTMTPAENFRAILNGGKLD